MEEFKKIINKYAKPTPEEMDFCLSLVEQKTFKKGSLLYEPGTICNQLAMIESGLAVMYSENVGIKKGVVGFYKEGNFVSDFYSFLTESPCIFNIKFIEKTTVTVLPRSKGDHFYSSSIKWERFGRKIAEKAYIQEMKNIYDAKFLLPKARYLLFLENHPDLLQRVPLYLIASYIDTSPETISRIRNELTKGNR